ncbi:MAG TPA: EamA family transporter [Terriglobales bacterium]|nr:EamA family transporter [Terriglobales bacterium]
MFYLTLLLTIAGSVVYHVAQKSTPRGANPFLSLAVSFGTAALACLLLLLATDRRSASSQGLGQLNWTSLALGASVLAVEVGFLLAYRNGWRINVASLISNSVVSLVLIVIAALFFGERASGRTLAGVGLCLGGLWLLLGR